MKQTMLTFLWSIALLFTLSASFFVESISSQFHVVFIAFQTLTVYVVLLNLLDSLLNLKALIESLDSPQKLKTKISLGIPIVVSFTVILSKASLAILWPSLIGLAFVGLNSGRIWYKSYLSKKKFR